MNKTKIEWTDYTWNPIVGCKNNCWYCYGKRLNKRFSKRPYEQIVFHQERLEQPLHTKKSYKIFVGSMTDLFAKWMPDKYITQVLNIVHLCPQHTFQFLTKNPERYASFDFSNNCWLGATVTNKKDCWRIEVMRNIGGFLSLEPLLEDISDYSLRGIKWIIIGALTGNLAYKYQPKKEWIVEIIRQADKYKIPIFMKNNLKQVWKGRLTQEFLKEGSLF